MICAVCKKSAHDQCPGGTQCFCQHRTEPKVFVEHLKTEHQTKKSVETLDATILKE